MLPNIDAQSLRQVLRRTRHGVATGLGIRTSVTQVRSLSKAAQTTSDRQLRSGMTQTLLRRRTSSVLRSCCAIGH